MGQNSPKNANDHEQRARVHPALPSHSVVVPAPELSSINVAVECNIGSAPTIRKGLACGYFKRPFLPHACRRSSGRAHPAPSPRCGRRRFVRPAQSRATGKGPSPVRCAGTSTLAGKRKHAGQPAAIACRPHAPALPATRRVAQSYCVTIHPSRNAIMPLIAASSNAPRLHAL